MKRRKILIIGPIGDRGGREIEAGFMANVLFRNGYDVKVLSTTYISENSQVTSYFPWNKIFSLNGILFQAKPIYKLIAYFAWIKNATENTPSFFLANSVVKKYFSYNKSVSRLLDEQIRQNDLLLFLGQLSSNYVEDIITKVVENKKSIFFRTTGEIGNNWIIPEYFKGVDLFLHHSRKNIKPQLLRINSKYEILDQTASNEAALCKISVLRRKISKFLVVGDVSSQKGVDIILENFSDLSNPQDEITIIGEGTLKAELCRKYSSQKNIKFMGFVEHINLPLFLERADCLVIASSSETGPYVGLEAMAAGRIILSTKVGAMENRLIGTENDFWFSRNDSTSFKFQFLRLKSLDPKHVQTIASKNREQYLDQLSNSVISKKLNNITENYVLCERE